MKIHKVEIHIDSTKTKTQKKTLTLLQEKKHHFPLNLDTPLSKLLRKQLSQEKNKKTHFDTILWVYDPKKKKNHQNESLQQRIEQKTQELHWRPVPGGGQFLGTVCRLDFAGSDAYWRIGVTLLCFAFFLVKIFGDM